MLKYTMELRNFIIERAELIEEALKDYQNWFSEGNEEEEKKYIEICKTIEELRKALDDANEFYPISHISKEDLKYNNEDKEEEIDELTDDEMIYIAERMSDAFGDTGTYSMSCEEALNRVLEDKE